MQPEAQSPSAARVVAGLFLALLIVGAILAADRFTGPRVPFRGARAVEGPRLDGVAVFGGRSSHITAQNFSAGSVSAVFGGQEIDFTRAGLRDGGADLEVNVAFGGVQIRVPPGWEVKKGNLFVLFGGVDDHAAAPDSASATLSVKGVILFGGRTVRN